MAGAPVTETVAGDDLDADRYWRWPSVDRDRKQAAGGFAWTRGGPLHFVNVTVNETMDATSGIQNQDRKGTGLAHWPVRHSAWESATIWYGRHPEGRRLPARPEYGSGSPSVIEAGTDAGALPLGRWVSISGAAFSTRPARKHDRPHGDAGRDVQRAARLLVGQRDAYCALKFRDSSSPGWRFRRCSTGGSACRERSRGRAEPPIGSGIFRTAATSRTWAATSSFAAGCPSSSSSMPRPIPTTRSEGLSELVRKARLDFQRRDHVPRRASSRERTAGAGLIPATRQLRRRACGRTSAPLDGCAEDAGRDEPLPTVGRQPTPRATIEVDRSRVSRAHAALATVEYQTTDDASWLVYVKATLMGDEPEDVCHYHRAHPEFPQETDHRSVLRRGRSGRAIVDSDSTSGARSFDRSSSTTCADTPRRGAERGRL